MQLAAPGYLVLGLAILAAPAPRAEAEAWQIQPYVRVEANHEDNRRLSLTDSTSSSALRANGAVSISRLTENSRIRGGLQLGYIWYDGDDSLRDQDTLLVLLDAEHKPTERQALGLRLDAKQDSTVASLRAPDQVEDELPGDPDDGLTSEDVKRTRVRVEPFWRYSLTQRSNLTLAYRYDDLQYDDSDRSNLSDQSAHTIRVGYGYNIDPISGINLGFRYGKTDREQADDTTAYRFDVGYRREFSEVYSFTGSLGAFRTERDNGGQSNDGGLVNFRLRRQLESGAWTLRLRQGLGLSGSGDVVQDSNLTFDYSQKVNPRTTFRLRARYLRTKSAEESNSEDNREYLTFEPALRWNWDRWTQLGVSYRYRRREFRDTGDSADSNGIFATLIWSKAQDL